MCLVGHITDTFDRTSAAATALGDVIKVYSSSDTLIGSQAIGELVKVLDDAEEWICSRLEPTIFSTLVRSFLQGETCLEAEHGIHMLAVSNTTFARNAS